MEATLSPPNAILFVLDLANDRVVVPEYEPGVLAVATESCVSVSTRADVDGDVTVRLSRGAPPTGKPEGAEIFKGSIATPGRKVNVVTSELKKVLEVEVDGETAQVSVATDDMEAPSVVWIEVG
jgi:6-phosphogluconolactonase (cycloisomerase 2 family)